MKKREAGVADIKSRAVAQIENCHCQSIKDATNFLLSFSFTFHFILLFKIVVAPLSD
jgi:hypothetical protein